MFLDRLPRNRAHGCLILSLAERGQKRAGAGCNRQCSFESSSRAPFNHSCGKQVPLKSKASAPFFVPCPGKNRLVFMQVDACYCLSSSRPSCRCYSMEQEKGRIRSNEGTIGQIFILPFCEEFIEIDPTTLKWPFVRVIK